MKRTFLFWWVPVVLAAGTLVGCASSDTSITAPTGSLVSPSTASALTSVTAAAITPKETGAPAAVVHCGTERWPVKTLSDSDAASVNFSSVQTTVPQLRSLPAPGALPQSSRVAPTELTTYSITALVKEFKLEDDQDIHLVITDPSDPSQTMIVEFPDASKCSGAVGSAHATDMIAARQALTAAFGQPSSSHFTTISGMATITGVAFFDFQHGQTGVAPNAIELHPVLSFATS